MLGKTNAARKLRPGESHNPAPDLTQPSRIPALFLYVYKTEAALV